MDILDFFENMGWGLIIVVVIVIFLFLIMFLARLIPTLLMGLGGFFMLFTMIILIGAVIYFIGKFAKCFVKNRW